MIFKYERLLIRNNRWGNSGDSLCGVYYDYLPNSFIVVYMNKEETIDILLKEGYSYEIAEEMVEVIITKLKED